MFKIFIINFLFILIAIGGYSQSTNPNHVYVKGYYKGGKWVDGYYRTAPNSTNRDNFSTRGNINPYTLEPGYITPDNNSLPSSNSSNTNISVRTTIKTEAKLRVKATPFGTVIYSIPINNSVY
jgi:hypothetical protein